MTTIAAISTPPAQGGIAMIRVSGENAIELSEHMFYSYQNKKPSEMAGYTCAYGEIRDGTERIDDVILTVFRAPHSYTGEDTVEITCHGGLYVSRRILGLLYRSGAEPAGPGEFTKRAFLNGKLSLSQAEAVMDLIRADGDASLRQANYAREGRLGKQMQAICASLTDLLSAMTYWLDDAEEFPPELSPEHLSAQITETADKLHDMITHYDDGRMLREGIRTVLLGLPNAGKSTVMNWLCGADKSIVTEYEGTTRDVITEQVRIGDYTLLLSDTAGIRDTDNPIETIGIAAAYKALDDADLVLYTVDAVRGLRDEDLEALARCGARHVIILWNKTDLPHEELPECRYPIVPIAAKSNPSLNVLADALHNILGDTVTGTYISALNERQQQILVAAYERISQAQTMLIEGAPLDLICSELEIAANKLAEIEGKQVTDDVIEGVFEKFCVGK